MGTRSKIWLKGLAAAIIGSTAQSVVLVIVEPLSFNPFFPGNWRRLLTVMVAAAILSAAMYFAQSPLPALATITPEKESPK